MQRQAEDHAAAFAAEAFSNWLHEGPMDGLGRQHQLSRTAVGWFPTKVDKPQANQFEPIDEVDGLSKEQLDSVSLQGQDAAPLTAQQIANDERCKWGGSGPQEMSGLSRTGRSSSLRANRCLYQCLSFAVPS